MSVDRTIFPDLQLFKRTVIDHFLVALREIYRIHPAYSYDDDPSQTKIHIEPTYGNIMFEGENPQMLVKVGQYEFALQDTLGMNMAGIQTNAAGIGSGFYSLKNMSTMVSVIIKAYAEEESSDIADELSLLGVYAARGMFTQVGLNIRGSSISETVESDTQKNIYQTAVNFSVDVPWQFTKFTDKEGASPGTTIVIPPIHNDGGYSPPGVYTTVFKDQSK